MSHGANLSVSYNKNGWTNKLGISVNEYNNSQYKLKIIINNDNSYTKTEGEHEFETADKIDSYLSNEPIKSIEFQLLDNSSGEIIAKQYIDTSNYDPLAPAINGDITVNKDYSSMNTITFKATDSGSGLNGLRYEYLASKNDEDKKSLEYMQSEAKYLDLSNLTNTNGAEETVVLKVPKDVSNIQLMLVDNAGNCSDFSYINDI